MREGLWLGMFDRIICVYQTLYEASTSSPNVAEGCFKLAIVWKSIKNLKLSNNWKCWSTITCISSLLCYIEPRSLQRSQDESSLATLPCTVTTSSIGSSLHHHWQQKKVLPILSISGTEANWRTFELRSLLRKAWRKSLKEMNYWMSNV